MNRYEAYKDSGIEWIGEIPSHWDVKRLKHLSEVIPSNVDKHIYPEEIQVRLCNYTDVYYNEKIDSTTPLKNILLLPFVPIIIPVTPFAPAFNCFRSLKP